MFLLPEDDSLPSIGTTSLMIMGLTATSYSIPVIGSERSVLQREASIGFSTGSYYLAKTISYLPISLFAPFIFLLGIVGLADLPGNLWELYALLVLVHLSFTGMGYVVSLITPPIMAQLVGTFLVLVQVMFAGVNPPLSQLQQNALLGETLYLPTYLSILRWGTELFYNIEIAPQTSSYTFMNVLYGYYLEDNLLCWSALTFAMVVWRIFAFSLLIMKEQ
eukprot:TRINITY_DN6617_c2_g1_i1.p1 TRINITY_DN6617_c2_g1~~TRINITY_DN6617_c2_g1_i1.p1  ORF type:complete len:220 (+),score=36.71 TRINITY_DN6617_c2_g1_i1:1417-2076(+)